MALLWRCAVMAHARRVPVQRAQRRACLRAIALDGEQIVGAVDVDNRAFGVVGGVQRIEGNQAPAHVDVLQQRLRGGNLAALVTAAAAGERAPVVGDQRHGFEVHARAAIAVGAADALAVGGERGRLGAVGHRTRRGPTPQHLGQGVGVDVGEHPAQRGVRRCDPTPRLGVAPRPQRAQLLLTQVPGEALRRRRPQHPCQARERTHRQHRRELVLHALAPTTIGHLGEQRAQLLARVPHRRRPARPLLALGRVGQALARIGAQRAHEHLLGHAVRVDIATVVTRESLRAPHPHPVRGVVGAAMETRRIHERLRQLQRMSVPRLPIRAHTPKTAPQHPRRQVRNPLRLGQNQKPRVVPNQMQAPKLHRPMPAHPPLARRALERPRLPTQQRQPLPAPHRDVAQSPARKLAKPQVVVLVHQRIPAPPLIGARHPHLDLADHHLRLVEPFRYASVIGRCAQI